MTLEVVRVPVLNDNYVWLIHDQDSGETVVVDPAVAEPVLSAANARGWTVSQIWNTHWHPDHTGGNADIKAATGCTISGPAAELAKIPTLDRVLNEGDILSVGAHAAQVMEVPAHTAGHIAYYLPQDDILFCGDTLFAMGCGRLFEGTAEQMYHNMQRFAALPPETQVYCAHEYTLSNARFAAAYAPGDEAVAQRLAEVMATRDRGDATVPTSISAERATNLFMRAGNATELAKIRAAKDAA